MNGIKKRNECKYRQDNMRSNNCCITFRRRAIEKCVCVCVCFIVLIMLSNYSDCLRN